VKRMGVKGFLKWLRVRRPRAGDPLEAALLDAELALYRAELARDRALAAFMASGKGARGQGKP